MAVSEAIWDLGAWRIGAGALPWHAVDRVVDCRLARVVACQPKPVRSMVRQALKNRSRLGW